jgi:CopG family transcriptional regulator, nickel-responsive regulator
MQRLTITVDDELVAEIDRVVTARGYQNRSEAIRDLTRAGLQQAALAGGDTQDRVAALVYVYDHAARELSKRLTRAFHDHHTLSLASLHVHLDHDSCMEVNVLRGRSDEVQHFAEHVVAERGVRHGQVVMMAAPSGHHGHADAAAHAHGNARAAPPRRR